MNTIFNAALPPPSSTETWDREPEDAHLIPTSNNKIETGREMVALFPAGRFFRFPVRVRIQIARESEEENAFPLLNKEKLHPGSERLGSQADGVAWASIENATCVDASKSPEIFLFGNVSVDFRKMELRRGGTLVDATALEFKTLHYFMTHPEAAISRDELLNHVWGFHEYPTTRTVDNRIMRLRKKLENDPSDPKHFLTIHGIGYRFVP